MASWGWCTKLFFKEGKKAAKHGRCLTQQLLNPQVYRPTHGGGPQQEDEVALAWQGCEGEAAQPCCVGANIIRAPIVIIPHLHATQWAIQGKRRLTCYRWEASVVAMAC